MKKNARLKLSLTKETLRWLEGPSLAGVAGGDSGRDSCTCVCTGSQCTVVGCVPPSGGGTYEACSDGGGCGPDNNW